MTLKSIHFIIVREDNLAPHTDASTTVCLYEFSAAKQVSIALLEKEAVMGMNYKL